MDYYEDPARSLNFPAYLMTLLLCICLPVRTDVMAVMTTDMTTEGPVMWQAANPTTKRCRIFGFCLLSFPQNKRNIYKLRHLSLSKGPSI